MSKDKTSLLSRLSPSYHHQVHHSLSLLSPHAARLWLFPYPTTPCCVSPGCIMPQQQRARTSMISSSRRLARLAAQACAVEKITLKPGDHQEGQTPLAAAEET